MLWSRGVDFVFILSRNKNFFQQYTLLIPVRIRQNNEIFAKGCKDILLCRYHKGCLKF